MVSTGRPFQRDEQSGLFQGENFKHRTRACAGDHEVGAGVCGTHVCDEFKLSVSLHLALDNVSLAADVEQGILLRERFEVFPHAVVERCAAAPAAENEQDFFREGDLKTPPRFLERDAEKLPADGRADVLAVGEFFRRFGKGRKYGFAFSRREFVGEPRGKVALMSKTRDTELMRRKDDGQGNVAAFGEHEVGLKEAQSFRRLPFGATKFEGDFQVAFEVRPRHAPHQLGTNDAEKGDFLLGDEPLFDAVRAHIANVDIPPLQEFLDDREVGNDVPGAPPARK